ncbi:O-antigen ligase family protein [Acidobacteriota bacterium]
MSLVNNLNHKLSSSLRSPSDRAIPRVLRIIVYLFVFSTIFDSFSFSFIRSSDNISRILGFCMLCAFLLFRATKIRIVEKDLKWHLVFFLLIFLEEIYRGFSLSNAGLLLSFRHYFSYFQVLLMYFIIRDVTHDSRAIRGIMSVYFLTYLTISLMNNFNLSSFTATHGDRIGVVGTNHNVLALLYATILICIFSWLLVSWSGYFWQNILLITAGASMLIGLVRTGSRGGTLALVMGLLVATFTHLRLRRLPAYIILLPLVCGGALYAIMTSDVLTKRIEMTLEEGDSTRTELTQDSLELFKEKPLIGHGSSYVEILGNRLGRGPIASHNTYLQILLSFGILGFMPFIIGIAYTIKSAWNKRFSVWSGMFFTVLLATLIFAIFGHLGYKKHFWIMIALTSNIGVMAADAKDPATSRRTHDYDKVSHLC